MVVNVVNLVNPLREGLEIEHVAVYIPRSEIDVIASRNVRRFGAPIDKNDPKTIELAKSFSEVGMLTPVSLLRRESGRYLLDYGFRRMCAADLLELKSIFAIVVGDEVKEKETDRFQRIITENEQREPLTDAELGFACVAMRDAATMEGETLSPARIAEKIGKSATHVYRLMLCADNLIPTIMESWKGNRGLHLPINQAVIFANMSPADQAVEWEAYCGRMAEQDRQASWRGHRPRVSRGAKRPEIEAAHRAAVHPKHREILAWVLDSKTNPCPVHFDQESVITKPATATNEESEHSLMSHGNRTSPIAAGAFCQAISQAESYGQIDKMIERYTEHGGRLALTEREQCEKAIERQENYLEGKGMFRVAPPPPTQEQLDAAAAKKAAAKAAKADALRAQLAALDEE